MNLSVLSLAFVTLWACQRVDDTDFFSSASGGSAGSSAGAGAGGVSSGGSGTTGGTGAVGGSGGVGGTGGKGGAGGTAGGSGGTTGGSAGSDGTGAVGGLGGGSFGGEGGAPELEGGAGGDGGQGACDEEEVCDGRDNDCDGEADPIGTCPAACKGFSRKHGHGYMVCTIDTEEDLTWSQAQERCLDESPRMHLAWIETAAENEFLRDVADELVDNELWIGATDLDVEGAWFWQPGGVQLWDQSANEGAGAPMNGQETQWAEGQPNDLSVIEATGEDCAVLTGNGKWNDYRCNITTVEGFICEID